ncbi:helix-turn-helix domain-containing protein [Deinococcus pimensis]|uniref:helix-turn-helix domain-containing protein n=1 Tax=Deinococcus pimensis TaxID=309888 RepID=UPI0012F7C919|nr:helix-turn-helix domain-containing protein [Deinococcus pimensis]
MTEAHRHGEIELNFVREGEVEYLFGPGALALPAGQPFVFWGVRPHRVVRVAPGTRMVVLTVPLATVLRFALPAALAEPLLRGEPVLGETDPGDPALLDRWLRDPADPEHRAAFELELHARLRRLALDTRRAPHPTMRAPPRGAAGLAARLAESLVARYADPTLGLGGVARDVGVHPNYAAAVFREVFGLSMNAFLTQYRVAHAQRLLLVTDQPVLDIAAEAGFGSVSRFYVAFRDATGFTPLQYRRRTRDVSSEPTRESRAPGVR